MWTFLAFRRSGNRPRAAKPRNIAYRNRRQHVLVGLQAEAAECERHNHFLDVWRPEDPVPPHRTTGPATAEATVAYDSQRSWCPQLDRSMALGASSPDPA